MAYKKKDLKKALSVKPVKITLQQFTSEPSKQCIIRMPESLSKAIEVNQALLEKITGRKNAKTKAAIIEEMLHQAMTTYLNAENAKLQGRVTKLIAAEKEIEKIKA